MVFDILLLFFAICLLIVGLIGCIIPAVPGPPLSYGALLLLQTTRFADFTGKFLWITAIVAVVVTVIDYVIPAWGTKKFRGSRAGVIGTIAGIFVGLLFLPWGIIVGPFVGAVVGELIVGRNKNDALRSGLGALLGFFFGVVMKLIVCIVFTYYFVKEFILYIDIRLFIIHSFFFTSQYFPQNAIPYLMMSV